MQSMTLDQFKAAASAGGVSSVTLKGQGAGFFVQVQTRTGEPAILCKARSREPRSFGNPASALSLLRDLGIVVAQIDATHWTPDHKDMSKSRDARAVAMQEAHAAAAYMRQLRLEVHQSLEDPRPNVSHADAMKALREAIR